MDGIGIKVSRGGMYLFAIADLPVGSEIRISFAAPNSGERIATPGHLFVWRRVCGRPARCHLDCKVGNHRGSKFPLPLNHADDLPRHLSVDTVKDDWKITPAKLRRGEEFMSSKSLRLLMLLAMATVTAWAQDPTKVAPTHYRLDFENEHVQVISVHYGPHEKSVLHEHPGGVVVSLTEAHLRFTDQNGKVLELYSKPGEARWFPPFKHRVENLGDTPYNAVYIGIRGMSRTEASFDPNDSSTRAIVDQFVAPQVLSK